MSRSLIVGSSLLIGLVLACPLSAQEGQSPTDVDARTAGLIKALKGRNKYDAENAAGVLGRQWPPTPGVVEALVWALEYADQLAAVEAAKSLGRLSADPAKAVPALARVVQKPIEGPYGGQLHTAAIEALGHFGPEAAPALPALIHALGANQGYQHDVQPRVLETLELIGPAARGAAPALQRLSQSKKSHSDAEERLKIALTLARCTGDPGQLQPLTDFLVTNKDQDRHTAIAMNLLGQAGPAAKAAIPTLAWIAFAPIALRDKKQNQIPPGIAHLAESEKDLRWAFHALKALEEIGPEAKASAGIMGAYLIWRDAHVKYELRERAAEGLLGLGADAREAAPYLKQALKFRTEGLDLYAAATLYCIEPDPAMLEILKEACQDKDDNIRTTALYCLARMRHKDALPLLQAGRRDDNELCRVLSVFGLFVLDPNEELAHELGVALRRRSQLNWVPDFILREVQRMGPAAKVLAPELRQLIVASNVGAKPELRALLAIVGGSGRP